MDDLNGKKIKVKVDGETVDAIVSGIDEDVGITIQEEDNKRYLYCINGPATKRFKRCSEAEQNSYPKIFNWLKGKIEEGFVDLHEEDKFSREMAGSDGLGWGKPSAEFCPFS